MERHTGERIAVGYLHAQQPVELPAALLQDGDNGRRGLLGPGQDVDGAQQLPDGDAAAGDVLAVVAGVVTATADGEAAIAPPAGVEPFGVRSRPCGNGDVACVRGDAEMPGGVTVAGEDVVGDGLAGSQQPEHPEGISAEA